MTTAGLAGLITFFLATDLLPWNFGCVSVRLVAAVAFWSMQATGPGAVTLFIEGSELVADYIVMQRRILISEISGVELAPSSWTPFFRRWPRLRIYVANETWVVEAETFASHVEEFVVSLGASARAHGVRRIGRLRRPRRLYVFDLFSIGVGAAVAAVYGRVNSVGFIAALAYVLLWTVRSWIQLARAARNPSEAPTFRAWSHELSLTEHSSD